jgi:hypothetical protein
MKISIKPAISIMLTFILSFYFLLLFLNPVQAQNAIHRKTFVIDRAPASYILEMGGYLDAENTFTYKDDLMVEPLFEPMCLIKLTNTGNTKIVSPRIIINNESAWYDIESLMVETLSGIYFILCKPVPFPKQKK